MSVGLEFYSILASRGSSSARTCSKFRGQNDGWLDEMMRRTTDMIVMMSPVDTLQWYNNYYVVYCYWLFWRQDFLNADDFGLVFWHLIMITKYNKLTNMTA